MRRKPKTSAQPAGLLILARRELGQWVRATVFERGDPDSLPTGWQTLAEERAKHPQRSDEDDTLYTKLVRPSMGGWVLVVGLSPWRANKDVVAAHESIADLYATVASQSNEDDFDPHGYWALAAQMLDAYVAEHYECSLPSDLS